MAQAAQASKSGSDRKCTTPKFRVSFPWVFKAQPPMQPGNGEPKYGVSMLFDADAQKSPQFAAMKKLAVQAAREKFGDKLKPDGKGWFVGLRNPFRDGAEKPDLEGYGEGVVFASATSKMQPGLVDASLNRIISQEEFYAGCYARATVVAYGYDKGGNKGVAFGLNNLQKLADGESFSGRVQAEDDFGPPESQADSDGTSGGDGDFLK